MPEPTSAQTAEPRRPSMAAIVATWLYPATSAQRTQHVSLVSAFAIHLAAIVLTSLLILCMVAIDERKTVAYEISSLLRELPRDWLGKIVVAGLFALMIEGGFLVLAFLVMPWGACDERLRASWKHALRTVWLHSTHALPIGLMVGSVVLLYDITDRNYYRAVPRPDFKLPKTTPKYPPVPKVRTQEAMDEYKKLVDQHHQAVTDYAAKYEQEVDTWRKRSPFVVQHGPAMVMWSIAVAVGWFLWALLQAVGVERRSPPITHPPTCEFCGYNLTGAASNGRCPECGEWVTRSLGPDVRPGTCWERRREIGRLRAWWRCAFDAIRRPSTIGRQIRTRSHVTDHRSFLIAHLPAGFVLGAAVAVGLLFALFIIVPGQAFSQQEYEILQLFIPMGGTIGVLIILAVTTLSAAVTGLICGLKTGRNCMQATMQIASYLSGFVTIWTCYAAVTVLLVFMASIGQFSIIGAWARHLRVDRDLITFLCYTVPNLPWLAAYWFALWRGTTAAQYANR